MIRLGSPVGWIDLLDPLIPGIVHLVAEAWPTLTPPAGDEFEDTVTENLCRALRRSRNARALPFRIDIQYVELDPAAGQEQGRIDIAFSPPIPREDIYFAFECKRLNVREHGGTIRPCHAEYLHFGMARFISGQYGAAVHAGGMLGYVLDGQVGHAIDGVDANIRQHHDSLSMAPPGALLPSRLRPFDGHARETRHRRPVGSRDFTIHHLFVACDPRAPLRAKRVSGRSKSTPRRRPRAVGKRAKASV